MKNNLDLITFDDKGQGIVNWDSLESFTSAELVTDIRNYVNSVIAVNFGEKREVFSIKDTQFFVTVFVKCVDKRGTIFVARWNFNKENKTFSFDFFNRFDVQDLISIFGGCFVMVKKPTILGFKPTENDWSMFVELVKYFNAQQSIGTVNNADVLKLAISELHKKYIEDQQEK